MRDVVGRPDVRHAGGRAAPAVGRAVGVGRGPVESALEPAPRDAGLRQGIADVRAAHRDLGLRRRRADVADRVGVADERQAAVSAIGGPARAVERPHDAVGLPGHEVEGARRRRSERRPVPVVAHGEVLRVVPERGHRVAVVVAERETGRAERTGGRVGRPVAAADRMRKEIHEAGVERELLRRVVVILIGGGGLRPVEAERVHGAGAVGRVQRVGVARQQRAAQTVHRRRPGRGVEGRLARAVRRVRIAREVVIERDVLVEDDHHVGDPGVGRCARGGARRLRASQLQAPRQRERPRQHDRRDSSIHHVLVVKGVRTAPGGSPPTPPPRVRPAPRTAAIVDQGAVARPTRPSAEPRRPGGESASAPAARPSGCGHMVTAARTRAQQPVRGNRGNGQRHAPHSRS